MAKICVAICAKDMMYVDTARTLLGIQRDLYVAGHDMTPMFSVQDSLLTRVRDTMVTEFLTNPTLKDCTHLLTVDSDISMSRPRGIIQLIDADKDIIGGIYRVKSDTDIRPATLPLSKETTLGDFDKPVECKFTSTGFLLVKREVFETLKDKVGTYNNSKKTYRFYPSEVKKEETGENILLSEDWGFCDLARENGFRIWAMDVGLLHWGLKPYGFDELRKTVKDK